MRSKILLAVILLLFCTQAVFAAGPTITSFSPSSGQVGSLVTIIGTNLSSPTAFSIGGKPAIVVSDNGTQLVGMVMPGAATGVVSVTAGGGTANSASSFTIMAPTFPTTQQGTPLIGMQSASYSEQGSAVAISADGNTAIVGAENDNSGIGSTYVYIRSAGVWTQQAKLVGTGEYINYGMQGSGVALSADGNTAMVGGYLDGSLFANTSGFIWFFTRTGTTWTQQGNKIAGTGYVIGSSGGNPVPVYQGYSCALSADGNTAIEGGYKDNNGIGAAWIFTRSSAGVWSQVGSKLVVTGGSGGQGYSVAMSADGQTALVGSGSGVYVYVNNGGAWALQGTELTVAGSSGLGSAVSLSADGNTALLGASGSGGAWVFTRSGGIWSQLGGEFTLPGAINASNSGGAAVSLSADGNTAVLGAPANGNQYAEGGTWVYTRSGNNFVNQGGLILASGNNISSVSAQGTSVALSATGTTALIGAPQSNVDQGFAYVLTAIVPSVTTAPATNVTSTTADINGHITTAANTGTVTFEYGTDPNLVGATKTTVFSQGTNPVAANSYNVGFTSSLTGLAPATTYYFRIDGTNINGTANGAILSFGTAPAGPPSSTLTFSLPSPVTYGTIIPPTISSTDPNGPIHYNSTNTNVITINSSDQIVATGIGQNVIVVAVQDAAGTTTEEGHASADVTVTPAPLTISADNKSVPYGQPIPPLTLTYTGLVNGDTQASITPSTITTQAQQGSAAGTYNIYFSVDGTDPNYNITYTIGKLTITPAYSTPVATTLAATNVTATGATLNGTANGGSSAATVTIQYTTDDSDGLQNLQTATLTTGPGTLPANSGTTNYSAALTGLLPNTTYYYIIVASNTEFTTKGQIFSFTTPAPATPPSLSAGGGVSGSISACAGMASASPFIQQFTVTGNSLTTGVTVTAPTGFQVSNAAATGYSSSITLPQTGGAVNATVYVRSAAVDAAGSISGNVVLSSTGATSINVAVTGNVNALATVNAVADQTVTAGSATTAVNFTGTANTFAWTNDTPSIGLAASGTGNIASFTAVNAGTTAVKASVTVVSLNESYAYIPNQQTVTVINTSTNAVVTTIPVGVGTYGVAVSPDGKRVYVVASTSQLIDVISTQTNMVIATIPFPNAATDVVPIVVAVSPDGSRLYVTDGQTGYAGCSVMVVNTATYATVATIPVNNLPKAIAISPDGSKVYVSNFYSNNVSVISTQTNTVTATIPVGTNPLGMVTSKDGSLLYVANYEDYTVSVINTQTNAVVSTLNVINTPTYMAISPDGTRLYVVNEYSDNVTVVNTATNAIVNTIPVGIHPWGISITSDGSAVYVTNLNNNDVSVINTSTETVIATVLDGGSDLGYAAGNFITPSGCSGNPVTFNITVNPKLIDPAVITFAPPLRAVYGSADVAPGATSTNTVTPITYTSSNPAVATIVNGNIRIIAVGTTKITASQVAGNGYSAATPVVQNFVVIPAALTITANNLSKMYLAVNPPLTITYTGFVNNESETDLTTQPTITTTATTNSMPGSYPITVSGAVDANYDFTYVNGTLTVDAPLSFGPIASRVYGDPDFNPGAVGTGVTYTSSNSGVATVVNGQVHITGAGSTQITATVDGNSIQQTLIITPAPLTITADNQTKVYGTPNPPLTVSYNGFVYSDNASSLTTQATITTAATDTSSVGTYSINAGAAADPNYSITYKAGTLTITRAQQTITFAAIPDQVQFTTYDLSGVTASSGLPVTLSLSNAGLASINGTTLSSNEPRTVTVIASQPGNNNYAAATNVNQTFNIIEPDGGDVIVEQVVSPNGDGINDVLKIINIENYPDNKLVLINRNGVKIYEASGYNNKSVVFDGHSNITGDFQQQGTYLYLLQYRVNGEWKKKTGFTVLRY